MYGTSIVRSAVLQWACATGGDWGRLLPWCVGGPSA
jgi:hypothetical protein